MHNIRLRIFAVLSIAAAIRVGEDRRSLLLDLPLVSDGQGGFPTARENP